MMQTKLFIRRKMRTDDLLGLRQNFLKRHAGGVENNRVRSRLQRRFGPVTIAVVALFKVAKDRFLGCALLFCGLRIGALPT
jgi:hypothetical protein